MFFKSHITTYRYLYIIFNRIKKSKYLIFFFISHFFGTSFLANMPLFKCNGNLLKLVIIIDTLSKYPCAAIFISQYQLLSLDMVFLVVLSFLSKGGDLVHHSLEYSLI